MARFHTSNLGKTVAVALAMLVSVEARPADQNRPSPGRPTSAEMPELSGHGEYVVGTEVEELTAGNRAIGIRFWFPAAQDSTAQPQQYHHRRAVPGQRVLELSEQGQALAPVKPLTGMNFPLIVMSHGYGGWSEHMSRLGETLASRGYVVASIDHRDLPFNDVASFAASFGSVLVNRSRDQQAVLRAVLDGAVRNQGVARLVDPKAIGVLGYSMGGYGAITTAGVPLEPAAPAFRQFPRQALAALPRPDPDLAGKIGALVALAPWGAQPDAMAWRDQDLGALKTPMLLIDGDQDDVVDFERGVKRLFATVRGSDRYLLVYREAAHNIAGNPWALPEGAEFPAIEFLTDPVWRKDRIEAINAHFIRAFFDLHLKQDQTMRRYLDVPAPQSNAGRWPSMFGQQWGGMVAGDNQPDYWRGFQRRWARGLEMQHKSRGE
ncbi:MAG: dienelactone hydrolase family protein [Porphyrobacter sp.]|nr:dienelactone hydrolase family protein [Porphyrobacter sp.]